MATLKNTRIIMIQGTASSSGKSLITAALCRIFHQDGYTVAPFKAQNMSNNSFVTHDGLEMGRAQVVQAYAAGLEPDVRMNPVLLKPSSHTGSQVVLRGKPAFTMNAKAWHETRDLLRCTIQQCYESLAAEYEMIVIEGAGSPAEINLKKNDIVNMGMAKMADAPVIIVGDIDRGGVFASLVGTMQLLDPDERVRVKGFVINKFRGDIGLLKPGLCELTKITGVPVLGVVPWIDHAIDDEDGVAERLCRREYLRTVIDICIIRLPHVSNFTDFIPLEGISGVTVRWCDTKDDIGSPDLLILPGTKTTIADLQSIRNAGMADAIIRYAHEGGTVIGICGGFQMLGLVIQDPGCVESAARSETGLGLLDMETVFRTEKRTARVTAAINSGRSWLFAGLDKIEVHGYEIHMGESSYGPSCLPFTVTVNGGVQGDMTGVSDATGRVLGTYVHGFFDSGAIVSGIVNAIRAKKGLAPLENGIPDRRNKLENELDRLAQVCRRHLNIDRIYRIICGAPEP
jgi:adenosylcobyric acid synthase